LKVTHLFRCEILSSNLKCISLLSGLWKFYRYFQYTRNNNHFESLAVQNKSLIFLSSWMFFKCDARKQTNVFQTAFNLVLAYNKSEVNSYNTLSLVITQAAAKHLWYEQTRKNSHLQFTQLFENFRLTTIGTHKKFYFSEFQPIHKQSLND